MFLFHADRRLAEALATGRIDGLSSDQVISALMVSDLLGGVATWADARFMFGTIERIDERTWRVPVDDTGHMSFEWAEDFGPVNLRLHE